MKLVRPKIIAAYCLIEPCMHKAFFQEHQPCTCTKPRAGNIRVFILGLQSGPVGLNLNSFFYTSCVCSLQTRFLPASGVGSKVFMRTLNLETSNTFKRLIAGLTEMTTIPLIRIENYVKKNNKPLSS